MDLVSSSINECSMFFLSLPHLTLDLKVRGHKMPEIRDFLQHSVRPSLHLPLAVLSAAVVQLLQVVAAVCRVVVGLVHQITVSAIPRLPEQVLLVSPLSEARVPQSLDVDILDLPLELLEAPGEVCAEAVLDIVADLEVGRSPLDVVFMGGVKVVDRIAHQE